MRPQSEPRYFGVQTHFGQIVTPNIDTNLVTTILDSIKKAGIKCIRDEMYWSIVETTPGVFNFPAGFDFYVEQARARGIDILLLLNYNNPLYAAHAGAGITTDTNRALFVRYCRAVLNRYIPKGIKTFEIWNEPNIPMFWDPTPSAADYAELLKKVYPALKAMDSTITIVGCATSPAEGAAAPNIEWKQFISTVFRLGGGQYLDGVSFHLYRVEKSPELFLEIDLAALQAIIGTNKKMFLTECGYHTSTAWPALSLQKQAEYIARLYIIGRKSAMLKQISYYDFRNDGETASNPEHNFGIVYNNLVPKPAYGYLRSLIAELEGKSYISSTVTDGCYNYLFSDSTGKTHAMWTTGSAIDKFELFSGNRLRKRFSDGSLAYQYSYDRMVSVPYSGAPVYITELSAFPQILNLRITPSSDTIIAGQSIRLGIEGMTADSALITVDSKAVVWSTLDTTASIGTDGVLKALRPGLCRVKAVFSGITIVRSFSILAAYSEMEVPAFNSLSSFVVSYQLMLPETGVSLIDTNFRTPPNSLLLSYSFKYAGIDKHRVFFDFNYLPLPGEPDSIFLDVYNNGNGHIAGFTVTDADGQDFIVNSGFSVLSGKYGWSTVKVTLRNFGSSFNYPIRLKRLTFYCVKSSGITDSTYKGTVLLDNLRIHNGLLSSTRSPEPLLNKEINLYPNYPNPFNPSTIITFDLPTDSAAELTIYDVMGSKVTSLCSGYRQAGTHQVTWNAADCASGVYFCALKAGGYSTIKKMLLVK